jgi:hypothetical protein
MSYLLKYVIARLKESTAAPKAVRGLPSDPEVTWQRFKIIYSSWIIPLRRFTVQALKNLLWSDTLNVETSWPKSLSKKLFPKYFSRILFCLLEDLRWICLIFKICYQKKRDVFLLM